MRVPDKQAARKQLQLWLQEQYRFAPTVPVLAEEKTIERDFGWVFFLRSPVRPSAGSTQETARNDYPPVAINRNDGAITVGPPGF